MTPGPLTEETAQVQAHQHLRVSLSIAALVLIVNSLIGVLRVPTAATHPPSPRPGRRARLQPPPQLLLPRQSAVISVFPVCHAGGSSTSLASAADSTQAPRCRVSQRRPSASEPSRPFPAPPPPQSPQRSKSPTTNPAFNPLPFSQGGKMQNRCPRSCLFFYVVFFLP